MNHTQFFKSLKAGELRPVYLFHGEEEFVKEAAFSALLDAVLPECRDFNMSVFNSGSARELMDLCEIAPFLSEKRVVAVHCSFKDEQGKQMAKYLERLPAETILVFYLRGRADGKAALIKKLKGLGSEVEFNRLADEEAARWVVQHAKKRGCAIDKSVAAFLISLVGVDMLCVSNETDKLVDYVGKRSIIERSDVDEIVTRNIEYRLFAMFDSFVHRNPREGFCALQSILGAKPEEESIAVAGYFLSCFKKMLGVWDLSAQGMPQTEICRRLNMRDYALRSVLNNIRDGKYTRKRIADAVCAFSDVAYMRVSGRASAYGALVAALLGSFV